MKRTLSFILSVVMVATLALTLFVGVGAAKDGDVLWEANFKGDSKFAPAVVASTDTTKDAPVTPSADGKSLNVALDGGDKGSFAWGGAIDGLKVTADTAYTIDVVFKAVGDDNSGITFLTGNPADPFNAGWHTLYGKTTSTFCLNRSGTSSAGFFWTNFSHANDAEGYATFRVEIYGYTVRVAALQADGTYKFYTIYSIAPAERETANIACGMFAYTNANKTATLDIKSFKVTQGCVDTPKYIAENVENAAYKTEGLFPAYTAAKNGDLVWSANFKGDANFAPAATGSSDKRANTKAEASADGKALTITGSAVGTTDSTNQGAYFYASPVKGLAIRANTEYTIEFKMKNEANYGGVIYYCSEDAVPATYTHFYGGLYAGEDGSIKNRSWTIGEGSNTSAYVASGAFTNKYVDLPEDTVLTDGYFDVKIELDGYLATVYYKTAEGYKELGKYYVDDLDATIACGYYNYQDYAIGYLKDFNVYKGLTVSNDYSKVDPDPTPTPTPTPNPGTGDNTAIAMVLAVISITSLGAVAVAKKAR